MIDDPPNPPVAGQIQVIREDLICVLAPNSSPMTHWGTNSFLIGRERLVLIDPGPAIAAHRHALLAAIDGRPVSHILVTHSHLDHSPLAQAMSQETGASVYAFGCSSAGRSPIMAELASKTTLGGGEGVDHDFTPDVLLADGAVIATETGPITAHHTPGHMGNHLCFEWQDALFSGDHVMGWSSSLISPPDGDLLDFMASCLKLQALGKTVYFPAHGGAIRTPNARVDWLVNHRKDREAGIVKALSSGPSSAADLARSIYADLPAHLLPAAERNVLAHLVALAQAGRAMADPELSPNAIFRLNER